MTTEEVKEELREIKAGLSEFDKHKVARGLVVWGVEIWLVTYSTLTSVLVNLQSRGNHFQNKSLLQIRQELIVRLSEERKVRSQTRRILDARLIRLSSETMPKEQWMKEYEDYQRDITRYEQEQHNKTIAFWVILSFVVGVMAL
ncbi:MAG: hypothetical protein OXF42_03300 [Candidatus Dadabacteria bacterium]|nr:hypothetical protein [Candidatus Dadabacteria bacterium]